MKRSVSLDAESLSAKKQRLKDKRRKDFVCKKCTKTYEQLKLEQKQLPKLRHLNENGRFDYCESCWKKIEYENYKSIDSTVIYLKETNEASRCHALYLIEFP